MVTKTEKVRIFQLMSVAGLSLLFSDNIFFFVEIPLAILFCVMLWVHLSVSRGMFFVYACVFVADLLVRRIDEYTLIFTTAFLIVLYELIDFVDVHSATSDDEEQHEEVMKAHLAYIAKLFVGCSVVPTAFVVAAKMVRIQVGYSAPLNILIFSVVVLGALLATRLIRK